MRELIKITTNENVSVVSARELHKFLGVSERFSTWIDRQFQYGFEEGNDYAGCKEFNTLANQELQDYALKLDCAKEISMIQRSEKGKEARKYFIECEKKLKNKFNLPTTFSEALLLASKQAEKIEKQNLLIENQKEVIKKNEPKVTFANSVIGSTNSILIRQFAKDLCDDNFTIGQNKLFEWFRAKKYLNRDNEPYQNYVDMGLFEVITRSVGSGYETFTTKTTKITGKGQVYFAKKIKNIS